jgi:hypothetical protein
MTVESIDIIIIFIIHYVADFLCQTRKIADNKGKDIRYLLLHGLDYTLVMSGILILIGFIASVVSFEIGFTWKQLISFGLINGLMHTITDFISSKFTSKFYAKKYYHAFFNVIGLDQLVHTITLIITYNLITI